MYCRFVKTRMFYSILTLLVGWSVLGTPTVSHAKLRTSDVVLPVISSVSVSRDEINTSCGDQYVEVTWDVLDSGATTSEISSSDVGVFIELQPDPLTPTSFGQLSPITYAKVLGTTVIDNGVSSGFKQKRYGGWIKIQQSAPNGVYFVKIIATDLAQNISSTDRQHFVTVSDSGSCNPKETSKKMLVIKKNRRISGIQLVQASGFYGSDMKYWALRIDMNQESKSKCSISPKMEWDDVLPPSRIKLRGLKPGRCNIKLTFGYDYPNRQVARIIVKVR